MSQKSTIKLNKKVRPNHFYDDDLRYMGRAFEKWRRRQINKEIENQLEDYEYEKHYS